MNTRQAIQAADTPPVLSLSFSLSRNRFIVGTSEGLRVLRTDNCLTTYHPSLSSKYPLVDTGIAITAVLDDRYIAYVPRGRVPYGNPNVVHFWDCVLGEETTKLDFREPVLGVKLGRHCMLVILEGRSVMLVYQQMHLEGSRPTAGRESDAAESLEASNMDASVGAKEPSTGSGSLTHQACVKAPNSVRAMLPTATNLNALGAVSSNIIALPAQATGQVQLYPIHQGSKRVLRAHTSALRAMALSTDGSILATASEQGTLIRVFETARGDQVAEFRRGVDKAVMLSLAISPDNRWLACTSDKGTLHVFDLNPTQVSSPIQADGAPRDRKSHPKSVPHANHRLSKGTANDIDSLSGMSSGGGRSLPGSASLSTNVHHRPGSAQEYYGLKPPPSSASLSNTGAGVSALGAFRSSPFAPKVVKDARSVASAPFSLGDEVPHWQGGVSHAWTTTPKGGRRRVRNPVSPLPDEPSGRPSKGRLCFAPAHPDSSLVKTELDGFVLYVVGGGTDAQWERFRLVKVSSPGSEEGSGSSWTLVHEGFRRYMSRQFAE